MDGLNGPAGPRQYLYALTAQADLLTDNNLDDWLAVIDSLTPGTLGTTNARNFAADIRSRGIDTVSAEFTDLTERLDLLGAWLATENWSDSQPFHAQHAPELHHPTTRTLLARLDHPAAAARAAILELADDLSIPEAYQIVTDLDHADDAALAAIDQGRLDHLAAILTASPLARSPRVTAPFANAVALLASHHREEALQVLEAVGASADQNTQRSHAIHLKRLAKHYPDLPGLTQAQQIFEPQGNS